MVYLNKEQTNWRVFLQVFIRYIIFLIFILQLS